MTESQERIIDVYTTQNLFKRLFEDVGDKVRKAHKIRFAKEKKSFFFREFSEKLFSFFPQTQTYRSVIYGF